MIYVLFLRQGFSPWHMKVNARCIARQRLFSFDFTNTLFNAEPQSENWCQIASIICCSSEQLSPPLPCLFWNIVLQIGDCLRFSLCVFRSMLHLSCNFLCNSKRRLLSNQTEFFFASYPKQSSGFKTNNLLRNTKQAPVKSKTNSFYKQNNLRFFYI